MNRLLIRLILVGLLLGIGMLSSAQAHVAGVPQPHAPLQAATADDAFWDDRFGTPGVYDGSIRAMASAADGSVYVAGGIDRIPGMTASRGIVRWDGRSWHALGTGVNQGAWVTALATQGSMLYAAGDFSSIGGVSARGIARWDGNAWARMGNGLGPRRQYYGWEEGRIRAVAVAPDGDVYVAGYFSHIDDVAARGIARWDGSAWHAVGDGLYELDAYEGAEPREANVYALGFAPDGTLYAGGTFDYAGTTPAAGIARWNGNAWSALGTGLRDDNDQTGEVRTLLFHDGTLYVGGMFNQAGGVQAAHIAAWDGAAWSALGDGMFKEFMTSAPVVALLGDGDGLIAAGRFDSAGGKVIKGLARWDGNAWSAVGGAQSVASEYLEVHALAHTPDGGFLAGGTIDSAGESATVFGIAHWDGERWQSLGHGVAQYGDTPADVRAIAGDANGNLFVGGVINYVAGIPVRHLAMWDGTRWWDIGGIDATYASVEALLVVGEYLYVGGEFTQIGGISAANIARYHIPSATWSTLGTGINDTVYALAYGDGMLFAGGGFQTAGGSEALDVAIWDGADWSGLGGEFEIFEVFDSGSEAGTYVRSLAYVHGDLYIGGHFQTIHDKSTPRSGSGSYSAVHNLVAYNVGTQQWYIVGPEVHPGVTTNGYSGFGTTVYALSYLAGHLYVGGDFNIAGGVSAPNLARYDVRQNSWSALGTPGGEDLTVRALDTYGPDLFVGGTFTTINTTPARFVGRYNTLNTTWSTLGSGLRWYNDKYTQVAAVEVTATGVYVGGKFDQAGDVPSLGFARWAGPLDPNKPNDPLGGGDPVEWSHQIYMPLLSR